MILTLFLFFFQLAIPFNELDRHVKITLKNEEQSSEKLTRYLINPTKNGSEKAYVIYSWIAHNIRYDVRAYQRGIRSNRDESVLKDRVSVREG